MVAFAFPKDFKYDILLKVAIDVVMVEYLNEVH